MTVTTVGFLILKSDLVFNSLLGVWKCVQTRYFVFDIIRTMYAWCKALVNGSNCSMQ